MTWQEAMRDDCERWWSWTKKRTKQRAHLKKSANWPNPTSKNSQTSNWSWITNYCQFTTYSTIPSLNHYNEYQNGNWTLSIYFRCRFQWPYCFLQCWTLKPCWILHQCRTFHQRLAQSISQSKQIYRVLGLHPREWQEANATPGHHGCPSLKRSGHRQVHARVTECLISHWDQPSGWRCHRILPMLPLGNDQWQDQNDQSISEDGLGKFENGMEQQVAPLR